MKKREEIAVRILCSLISSNKPFARNGIEILDENQFIIASIIMADRLISELLK